jgi:hypothetical protein
MFRQDLIDQVKAAYGRLADIQGTETYSAVQFEGQTPEVYYEQLLSQVIARIEAGDFDSFTSGQAIIEHIANNG